MNILSSGYAETGYLSGTKLDPQPFINTKNYWQQRLMQLNEVFRIAGEVQQIDTPDRLMLRNERYHLHVYKASNSFVYFDRHLVSPTDPVYADKLISEPSARKKAQDQLQALGLINKNLQAGGIGYTGVTVEDSPEKPFSPAKEYKTEVKVHYGFQLHDLPVFGPGAKTVVSYAGTELSQLIYFWRTPELVKDGHFASSKVAQDRPLISQEEALHYFAHDNRFTKLKKGNAKVRFHEIQLGYYAKSPQEVQRFLYPVYRVSGTIETWENVKNGYTSLQEDISGDVFRYHFTLYILAVSDPNTEEKKMFGPFGKMVTTF